MTDGVFGALALAALLVMAWWLHVRYWTRRLTIPVHYDACERLKTPDGGRIELRRLRARSPTSTERQLPEAPVLLVHGLGANHRNFDLDDRHSLARHLARRGRDVWLLTLRSALRPRGVPQGFSAMAYHDVPAAVQAVLDRTKAPQLDYIGFSMGGMLLYSCLGRSLDAGTIRRVVTVGSPAQLRLFWSLPIRWVRWVPRRLWLTVPLRFFARTAAFAAEWFRTPLHRYLFNPENVAKGIAQRALVNIIEPVPAELNRDFASWLSSSEGQLSLDGVPVIEGLAKIKHPALFIAGAADRLAPPEAVRVAFDAWGGEDKSWHVLGREAGCGKDYGHGDLTVGERLISELYEPIEEFLASEIESTVRS